MKNGTFKMKALQAGVILALAGGSAVTAQAAILNVTSLSITGGNFTGYGTNIAITAGSASPLITGTYQGGAVDPTTGGTYGTSNSIATFTNGSSPIYTFTAANADECVPGAGGCTATSSNGLIPDGPYAAPTGTVDTTAGTITMNLPSFFAEYLGVDANVGTSNPQKGSSANATGTYNPANGDYTLSWTSIVYAPNNSTLNGQSTTWTLSGIATVVPLPATSWLMGSGLLSLVGIARRKSKASMTDTKAA